MEISKRFSFGVALTFTAKLLMAANSVIAGVIVARLLGAESLGMFLVLNVTVQTVIQLSTFGLPMANTFYTARDPENLVPAAMNGALFGLTVGSGCALAVWLLSGIILPGVPADLTRLAVLAIPFQAVTILVFNLFLARGEIKWFNFLDYLNQSFVLINCIGALVIVGGGLVILVAANAATAIFMMMLTAIIFYRYVRRNFPVFMWRLDASLLTTMLQYAVKGYVLWIATFLVYRLDLIIVNYFRGAAEASVYAVASQCALLLLLIPSTVSQVLQSKMVAQDLRGEFTCRVARGTSLLLAVACLLSIPMAVLVARVYGPDFSMLPQMLWILLPGVFFVGMQQVLTQYFFATGLSWRLPLSWVLTLVISLGLDLWFVPRYGAIGAAIVSTVSYSLISVATFVFFKTRTNNGLRAVLLPRPDELGELFRSLVNQPEQG